MKEFQDTCRKLLSIETMRDDRTKTGTFGYFGEQWRFNLLEGLPLVSSKFTPIGAIVKELLWILSGSTNNNDLTAQGVHIWDEWAVENKIPLTPEERASLLYDKLTAEGYKGLSIVSSTSSPEIAEAAHAKNFKIITADISWDDAVTQCGIPTHKSGPLDGELGPIYGHQWRSWDTGQKTRRELTLEERLYLFAIHDPITGGSVRDAYLAGTGPVNGREVYFNTECDLHGISKFHETSETLDQIQLLIDGLKTKPFSRRHIVTAWQPKDIMPENDSMTAQEQVQAGKMALAPCHCFFQFYVSEMTLDERFAFAHDSGEFFGGYTPGMTFSPEGAAHARKLLDERGIAKYKLSCQLYQRSADFCLGVPFNTASYAIFTMMVAQCVGMAPGDFIHTFGDIHMYSNHVEGAKIWVERDWFDKPKLRLNPNVKNIFDFKPSDFTLTGYKYHPKIDFDVAI